MSRQSSKRPPEPSRHQRSRNAGLRQIRIWVPDTSAPGFAETCRRQARAIAAGDPGGDEIMQFVADVYEWPHS